MADMYKPVGLTKAVGLLPKSDRRQRVEGRYWLGAALRSPESFETLIRKRKILREDIYKDWEVVYKSSSNIAWVLLENLDREKNVSIENKRKEEKKEDVNKKRRICLVS